MTSQRDTFYTALMRLLFALLLLLGFAAPAGGGSRWRASTARPSSRRTDGPLSIKGISLGNWLMPEGYMFKFEVAKSPRQIFSAFDRLLGSEHAASFWTEFRDTYIARDDIRFIKSVGFNTVRIPLHYHLFMTDQGEMTGEGWALLDRVLGWVREAGLFAIVDLHAAPGGQTGINHDDGPGYPLMFYVPRDPRAHGQAVARHRPALQRRSGDPGLRHPERTDSRPITTRRRSTCGWSRSTGRSPRRSARSIPAAS